MKVLIADDEPDVRTGLKTIIDWNSLGFEVCGEAENGEVCLRKILSLVPDLVLLDIRMPKMHGLDCAREARKAGWNGKIIILSGYSDFKYAQSAIECGVEAYLLKPIDEDELADTVRKIREKILAERHQQQKMDFALEKAHNAMLSDLLNGKIIPNAGGENMKPLNLDADSFLVIILERMNPDGPVPSAQAELERMLKNGSAERIKLNGADVWLLKGRGIIDRFNHLADSAKPEEIFFAVGRTVADPSEISLSYHDADRIYTRRFFLPADRASVRSMAQKKLKPCDIGEVDLGGYAEKIFTFLQAGNYNAVNSLLNGLRDRFASMGISERITQLRC